MKTKVAVASVASVVFAIGLAAGRAGVLSTSVETGAAPPADLSDGVAVRTDWPAGRRADLAKAIAAAPDRPMKQCGLVGVAGGAHVQVSSSDPQDVLLPIPQLTVGQVPLCFYLTADPPDALAELRLRTREGRNVVAGVRLAGGRRDVRLTWSAVVLLAPNAVTPDDTSAEPYLAESPCVQAKADEVVRVAAATWPASGKPAEFAAAIQRHVAASKRREQPRSLDAVGILKSGESGICTANANLAAAMMRSKGIACRTVAVVPPTAQKLEMHRIAEYHDGGRWVAFDPSSLQTDVPARPWQNVVMARTTPTDERLAMTPRRGAMVGCPYGHEIELLGLGVNLSGQDFFWTLAKPLAEFEPTDEAARSAAEAWKRYLTTGASSDAQFKAASAKTAAEFAQALRPK